MYSFISKLTVTTVDGEGGGRRKNKINIYFLYQIDHPLALTVVVFNVDGDGGGIINSNLRNIASQNEIERLNILVDFVVNNWNLVLRAADQRGWAEGDNDVITNASH
jgi:hypothetical protein